jgi:hypothetical protein
MVRRLETPRLELRPVELADAVQVQVLVPHWEIVRYLASHIPWPYPEGGPLPTSATAPSPRWSAATSGSDERRDQ